VDYNRSFVVAITGTELWISDSTSIAATSNLLLNGGFDDAGTSWTEDTSTQGSISYPGSAARLNSGNSVTDFPGPRAEYAAIEQSITGLSLVNNHILRVETSEVTARIDETWRVQVGTAQGLSDVIDREYEYGVDVAQISFVPPAATLWVRVQVDEIRRDTTRMGQPVILWVSDTRDVNQITLVDEVATPSPEAVTFVSPWSSSQLRNLQMEMAPDFQRMYFCHREVTPQVLEYDIVNDTWTFIPVVFTWAAVNPWTLEFPGAITFFESRMYLASTITQPVAIWASTPGRDNYHVFSDEGGPNPADPLKFILARNCDIQWMAGSKVLYLGADNSEHVITSDGPAVTNADNEVNQVSAYGSDRIKTNLVAQHIMYPSWDGRRVRIINHQTDSRTTDSQDLTYASEHITSGIITEIHLGTNPLSVIWVPLGDGTFTSCSYADDEIAKNVSWSRHSVPGAVKSMCVVEEQGRSVVYVLALRDGVLRLLRMGSSSVYMDEYVVRGYATATNTVTDLDHLEGDVVQVVGDGAQYPDAVVTGGQITTVGPAATDFIVGLPLPRLLETTPPVDSSRGDSTAASRKGYNRIYVRVLDSAIPVINGKRPAVRTPTTPMDGKEPNRSQNLIVQNSGYDYEPTITIEQNLPFNLTVTGIFGEIIEENL
jgi:hypothetical protein